MYHYTECGLRNVWLVNGYRPHETPYGEAVIVENIEDLHRAIARQIIAAKPRLTGAEFRFLRRELDISQAKIAQYFGYEAQSVALWEKQGKVPKWADRVLRAMYREKAEGNARISEILERLTDTDQQDVDRQVFEETEAGWTPKAA